MTGSIAFLIWMSAMLTLSAVLNLAIISLTERVTLSMIGELFITMTIAAAAAVAAGTFYN